MSTIKDQYKQSVDAFLQTQNLSLPAKAINDMQYYNIKKRKNTKRIKKIISFLATVFLLIIVPVIAVALLNKDDNSTKTSDIVNAIEDNLEELNKEETLNYSVAVLTNEELLNNIKPYIGSSVIPLDFYYYDDIDLGAVDSQKVDKVYNHELIDVTLIEVKGDTDHPIHSFEIVLKDDKLAKQNQTLEIELMTIGPSEYNNKGSYGFNTGYAVLEDNSTNKYYCEIEGYPAWVSYGEPYNIDLKVSYYDEEYVRRTIFLEKPFTNMVKLKHSYESYDAYFYDNQLAFEYNGIFYYLSNVYSNQDGTSFGFWFEVDNSKLDPSVYILEYTEPYKEWLDFIDMLHFKVNDDIFENATKKYRMVPYRDTLGEAGIVNRCYGYVLFPNFAKEDDICSLIYDGTTIYNYNAYEKNNIFGNDNTEAKAKENETVNVANDIVEKEDNDKSQRKDSINKISKRIIIIDLTVVVIAIIYITCARRLYMKFILTKLKNNFYMMNQESAIGYRADAFNHRVSTLDEIELEKGLFAIEVEARNVFYTGMDISFDGMIFPSISKKDKLKELCFPDDRDRPTLYASKYKVKLEDGNEIECLINNLIYDIPVSGQIVLPIGKKMENGMIDCFSDFVFDHYLDGTIDTHMNIFKRFICGNIF